MLTLSKLGTRLQGHPHRESLPGLETTSGPLGSGLSQASGMAYGLRMDKKRNHVYVMTSDGEHNEGNTWESILFISKNKLDNLTAILDRNFIQIDGNTEEIMPLGSMKKKYLAFGWNVVVIDGNNMDQIVKALKVRVKGKPTMIIAKNIPGKGVSFMENDYRWHGMPPDSKQAEQALEELEQWRERIENGE